MRGEGKDWELLRDVVRKRNRGTILGDLIRLNELIN
jgi:hypothetical protein